MITLQECLNQLARGKLSNSTIAESGKIKEKFLDTVIDAINEGLLRLYTQFNIKEKSLLVELYEGRTEYPLTSAHSIRKVEGTIYDPYDYYIRDTEANPFEDDILTIMKVWDDLDRERPLNDPESLLAVFTPEPNHLTVNVVSSVRVLNIIYRAKHLILTSKSLEDKVELPSNLYGALFSFVAFMVYDAMNTEEAVTNAQKYYAEYQNIVNEIIQHGTITPDKLVLDRKFIKRGWV